MAIEDLSIPEPLELMEIGKRAFKRGIKHRLQPEYTDELLGNQVIRLMMEPITGSDPIECPVYVTNVDYTKVPKLVSMEFVGPDGEIISDIDLPFTALGHFVLDNCGPKHMPGLPNDFIPVGYLVGYEYLDPLDDDLTNFLADPFDEEESPA